MYQFLYLVGPGALSFVLVQFFMKDSSASFISGIAQIIAFSIVNNAIALSLLIPFSKVILILNEDGTSYVQYGTIAILVSLLIAVLLSLVVVMLKKHVSINIRVEEG